MRIPPVDKNERYLAEPLDFRHKFLYEQIPFPGDSLILLLDPFVIIDIKKFCEIGIGRDGRFDDRFRPADIPNRRKIQLLGAFDKVCWNDPDSVSLQSPKVKFMLVLS